LPVKEWTVCKPRNGRLIRQENIDSKLYPLCLNGARHLQRTENEKHFKEPKMKSGSNHLGVKPFFNSEILLISLFRSMIICVW
jgi:hypothetical protein